MPDKEEVHPLLYTLGVLRGIASLERNIVK
jgi:hypothetical protein